MLEKSDCNFKRHRQIKLDDSRTGLLLVIRVLCLTLVPVFPGPFGLSAQTIDPARSAETTELSEPDQSFNSALAMKRISLLNDDSLAKRISAEQHLVKMGAPLVNWLNDSGELRWISSETSFRLQRIRLRVFANQVKAFTVASTIRIDEDLNSEQLVKQIQTLTGNLILIAGLNDLVAADSAEQSFWSLVEQLCIRHDLVIDYSDSIDHLLVLTPASNNAAEVQTANQGLIRIEWVADPTDPRPQTRLRILWEPRLRLTGLRIPMAEVSVVDTEGKPWGLFNPNAVFSIPTPDSLVHKVIRLPIRSISELPLETLSATIELNVVAPNANCVFDHALGPRLLGQTRRFGGALIAVDHVDIAKDHVTIRLSTRYDTALMALPLQSHLDWEQWCSAELVGPQGKRIAPIRQRQVTQEPFRYVIEYSFQIPDERPEEWSLRFQIPSGIILVNQKIQLSIKPPRD